MNVLYGQSWARTVRLVRPLWEGEELSVLAAPVLAGGAGALAIGVYLNAAADSGGVKAVTRQRVEALLDLDVSTGAVRVSSTLGRWEARLRLCRDLGDVVAGHWQVLRRDSGFTFAEGFRGVVSRRCRLTF